MKFLRFSPESLTFLENKTGREGRKMKGKGDAQAVRVQKKNNIE